MDNDYITLKAFQTVSNLINFLCAYVFKIKSKYKLDISPDEKEGFDTLNSKIRISKYFLIDNFTKFRSVPHEAYHLFQKTSGLEMGYSLEDRKRIENGEWYVEYFYDFEIIADIFSYVFTELFFKKVIQYNYKYPTFFSDLDLSVFPEEQKVHILNVYNENYAKFVALLTPIFDEHIDELIKIEEEFYR